MNYIEWIFEHWYLFFGFAILWVYFKYSNKERIGNLSFKEMFIIIELGFYIFMIYIFQIRFFNSHNWFLISIPIFLIIWTFVLNYILSKDNVFVLESRLKGEEFFDTLNGKKVMSLCTDLQLLEMDREYYNAKSHIGDITNPLHNLSRKIKFTDYYDNSTGIFYHAEYPDLQNINLFTRIATWLKFKKDVPKLIKENITHTVLSDYKTAYQLIQLQDNIIARIPTIFKKYQDKPFELFPDMESYYEFVKTIRQIDESKNTESENKEGESIE